MAFGARAEKRAAALLTARGYRVLARNYRCTRGEIDIVAADGDALVFVEVKARKSDRHGSAAEAIGPQKRRRLIAAAEHYLAHHDATGDVRFDVVAFTGDDIEIIVDAFRA